MKQSSITFALLDFLKDGAEPLDELNHARSACNSSLHERKAM